MLNIFHLLPHGYWCICFANIKDCHIIKYLAILTCTFKSLTNKISVFVTTAKDHLISKPMKHERVGSITDTWMNPCQHLEYALFTTTYTEMMNVNKASVKTSCFYFNISSRMVAGGSVCTLVAWMIPETCRLWFVSFLGCSVCWNHCFVSPCWFL